MKYFHRTHLAPDAVLSEPLAEPPRLRALAAALDALEDDEQLQDS